MVGVARGMVDCVRPDADPGSGWTEYGPMQSLTVGWADPVPWQGSLQALWTAQGWPPDQSGKGELIVCLRAVGQGM